MSAPARRSFFNQAKSCADLGSPFTQLLCATIGDHLAQEGAVGQAVLNWSGDARADALALRLCGALHALVRAGHVPRLAALYPPAPLPEEGALWQAVDEVLRDRADQILAILQRAPQTNEVARSSALLAGFLSIAAATRLPLDLIEIGASAGLNQMWDAYGYRLRDATWGAMASPVQLAPTWRGNLPPLDAPVRVVRRAGCDLNPLDVTSAGDRERLFAYVWPDQPERLARLAGALDIARRHGTRIATLDAADFVARELARPAGGAVKVLYHTIVWQYLPHATQTAIGEAMAHAGWTASVDEPLAWLAMEADDRGQGAGLTLTLWPGGQPRVLARADFHGRWVDWT